MIKNNTLSPGPGLTTSKIDCFLASPGYVMLIALLAALSNMFGLELIVFSIFALLVAFVCIKGEDLLPLIPLFICAGMSISAKNNPGKNPDSVFTMDRGGILLICVGVVIVGSIVYRIIRDRKNYRKQKYSLLSGMLVLTVAYMIGGIGSNGYENHWHKSAFFGLLNGIAITVPYVLFSGGVNWSKTRKDYLAWVGFAAGCLLLCEVAWIYISADVLIEGTINRRAIYTGWGMYNNMGSILVMTLPFPFYLGVKYRKPMMGVLLGGLFMIGTAFTCSRNSILCGAFIFLLCLILTIRYVKSHLFTFSLLVMFVGGLLLVLALFGQQLLDLFSSLLSKGLDPNTRDDIYKDGLTLFSEYPVLGGSFFNQEYVPWGWATNEAFTGFIPPRWHNTIIQLLASCGIVGLAAYIFHRIQTINLFVKDRTPETRFTTCSLLALLASSLLDCHFFNIGPVLFYSMALAFMENSPSD